MAVVAVVAVTALSAGPVGAIGAEVESTERAGASVTGCRGELISRDADGRTIDRAVGEPPHRVIDPDDDAATFTRTHPFEVVSSGDVVWSGATTTVITDQSQRLTVWGVTVARGTSSNEDGADAGEGTFALEGLFPVGVTGLVKVDGALTGQGGQCLAAGWVKFGGSPVGSLLWFAALGLTVLGVGLAVLAQPRQRPARRAT